MKPRTGPRKGPKRRKLEDVEQAFVVRELRRLHILFNAQSNGLPLSGASAAGAVRLGLEKGCPDLMIFTRPPSPLSDVFWEAREAKRTGRPFPSISFPADEDGLLLKTPRGIAIEFKVPSKKPKTDRAGMWSGAEPHQKVYLDALLSEGWVCLMGYGSEDALEKLRALGFPVRVKDGERWRKVRGPRPPKSHQGALL